MNWRIREAKDRFNEVVGKALEEGPQTVTRPGKPVVVIISAEQYARETRRKKETKRQKLTDILLNCPVRGWTISERDKDAGRDITF